MEIKGKQGDLEILKLLLLHILLLVLMMPVIWFHSIEQHNRVRSLYHSSSPKNL
jgi:hypothetical protein